MELTYLTVCTQNTENVIIKISMLIGCIFEYFQKKRKVLTMNKKMEILTILENGMKSWKICQKYKV